MEYRFTPYKKRNVSFLNVMKHGDWKMKVYGINLEDTPRDKILYYLGEQLPTPACTEVRYGLGFLIIHRGVEANWFLLNWWSNEDIVRQKLYASSVDNFNAIKPVEDQNVLACVHELDIYSFESEAWKRHVLRDENPDFEGYLKDILD